MNKLFINNIGDLLEIQHASFFHFLFNGISQEFQNFTNPLSIKIKFPTRLSNIKQNTFLYLSTNHIQFQGPSQTVETCLNKHLTYAFSLYIPGQYSYTYDVTKDNKLSNIKSKLDKILIKQNVLFGEIPLMTNEGSFIINGYEKVIVSQIIRSPGVYFQKTFKNSKKLLYTATIISDKGTWTRILLEEEEKTKKNNFVIALKDYQQTYKEKKEIPDNFHTNSVNLLELIQIFGISYKELYEALKYPELVDDSILNKISKKNILRIKTKLFNSNSGIFSIGTLGRYNLNKSLELNLPKTATYLTVFDLIEIANKLLELKYFDRLADDIDHLKNKRIRSVGELLQNQIRVGFFKLKKNLSKSIKDKKILKYSFENDKITDLKSSTPIIDPHLITNVIKDFFITSQLSQFMDQINLLSELTHKRRISVFGPNGLQRDHVSFSIRDISPSQYGKLCPIETPEGQNAGLISSLAVYARLSPLGFIETPYFYINNGNLNKKKQALYLNAAEEQKLTISFPDYVVNKNYTITTKSLPAKKDSLFFSQNVKNIDLHMISSSQLLSLATTLIPFSEHDDANRTLMGSNMQRQAVALMYTQKAIVGTGFESVCPFDSQTVIKNYQEGTVLTSSASSIVIKDNLNQVIYYYLKKYKSSNQKTCLTHKPLIWPYEKVFAGQILADGASTNEGELSLGKNLTIAYMPWEGYNFEDAIVISDKLIDNDSLTSIHIEEYQTTITHSSKIYEKLATTLGDNSCRNLDRNGIIKIGSDVKEGDILVGKVTTIDDTELTKLIRSLYKTDKTFLKDNSLRVTKRGEGKILQVKIFPNLKHKVSTPEYKIYIYVAQKRKINVGDKLSGRHGNKGVISRILKKEDMPFLLDGTPVDILLNPLGVPSRMNVGQIFECLLGFAGYFLEKRYKVAPFDEIYGKEASRVLIIQKLKEAAILNKKPWLFNSYAIGKNLLRDGRTGEFFDNPILVGKSYILKLIHLVDDKIHARSTGPYTKITEQPLAGKSQQGGQRFGEMEVWALEAYGASNILQELFTLKADDIDGRNDIYESILLETEWTSRIKVTPSIPEAFLVLIRELNALGLCFNLYQVDNTTKSKNLEKDIFKELEKRLKLRKLLEHKKASILSKAKTLSNSEKNINKDIFNEKLTKAIKIFNKS